MSNDFSLPMRALPPGRLAQRTEHLRCELARAQRPRLIVPRPTVPRLRIALPALLIVLAATVALALVPIGGARLLSRAVEGISGVWHSRQLPPPPRPCRAGDRVWMNQDQVPAPGEELQPPPGYTPPLPPAAPPRYRPGDKVWTTPPPPTPPTVTTITRPNGTDDAAGLLARPEREGSSIGSVDCR